VWRAANRHDRHDVQDRFGNVSHDFVTDIEIALRGTFVLLDGVLTDFFAFSDIVDHLKTVRYR
jgi:hypothetical protein